MEENLNEAENEALKAQVPQKKKGWEKIVIGVLIAVICISFAVGGFFLGRATGLTVLDERMQTFLWAKERIESEYYLDLDEDRLYDDMMAALESQLDAYSRYYTEEEYAAFLLDGQGSKEGIGLSIMGEVGETPMIYTVVENSPACLAGLQKGMYVTAFSASNGEKTTGDRDELTAFVKSNKGEIVLYCGKEIDGSDSLPYTVRASAYTAAYCFYRDSESAFAFRGDKAQNFVEVEGAMTELPTDTAYIRLDEFMGDSASQFVSCLQKMKERGRMNLILDLRYNGGGYLDTLQSIASHLLRNGGSGKPIVAYANYPKHGKNSYYTKTNCDFNSYFNSDSRITVFANAYTASASEALIGAMIDYGTITYADIYLQKEKAEDVAKTYGKGIMQSYFSSDHRGTMKLTVATIHWPISGTCIQGVGVTEEDGANAIVCPFLSSQDEFLNSYFQHIG